MKFLTLAAALSAGLVLPGTLWAQTGDPVAKADVSLAQRMALHVSTHAFESMHDLLPPNKKLRLALVAKQRAAAISCEGIEVDENKFQTVMTETLSDVLNTSEPDKNNHPFDAVMMHYGVMLGGELAQAGYDPDGYCAAAGELRTEFQQEQGGAVIGILQPAP